MVKSKIRKKYMGPTHLWQQGRIKEETQLRKEYGYKNKKEIWKVQSILRKFRDQARRLISLTGKQAQLEKQQLLSRLASLGVVKENAKIEDVLALTVRDLLERRLQTLVYRKKMANTISQSRQFISHGHISVGDMKITSPSYMVKTSEESKLSFAENSPLADETHPERAVALEKLKREKEKLLGEAEIKKDESNKAEAKKEEPTKSEAKKKTAKKKEINKKVVKKKDNNKKEVESAKEKKAAKSASKVGE